MHRDIVKALVYFSSISRLSFAIAAQLCAVWSSMVPIKLAKGVFEDLSVSCVCPQLAHVDITPDVGVLWLDELEAMVRSRRQR
ncbi:hypothetical protein BKA62DRAFT_731034 [Auriculariales sp. MPI-PUGE-AT-0066]|nr:hypothetical protein BKA62DRAFT_731034 [Auriculariales sp. MPI-PUGE-AT-0066]